MNGLKKRLLSEEDNLESKPNKAQFRRYEEARENVKAFYKEQHGKTSVVSYSASAEFVICRETDGGVQHESKDKFQNESPDANGCAV